MKQNLSVLSGGAGGTSGSLTPDFDTYEVVTFSGLTGGVTVNAPTSVAQDGRRRILRFKDNGTARSIGWDPVFRAVGVTLPTTTVVSKMLYVGVIYNATDSKWDAIAVGQEA